MSPIEAQFTLLISLEGPRNCIGQKFAIYELKSSICKIVKNFQLSISKENETLKIYGDLILKSANGVKLTVKKR